MTRRVLAAGLLLLCTTATLPAQPATGALEAQLPSLAGAARAHALTDLTDQLKNDSPRKAIEYGREALAFYAAHSEPAYEVRTLDEIAWAYMIVSDYPNAIASATKGRDLAERGGDVKGLARALNNLGVIDQRRGNGAAAMALFDASLRLYRQAGLQLEIAAELSNLGFVASSLLADYDRALAYQLEALKIRESLGDRNAIALSMNNIGIIYDRTGNFDKAIESYQQSLELRKGTSAQNRIAATLTNLGDVYLEKGDLQNALDAQQQSLALRRQVGDPEGTAFSLSRLGKVYTRMGRYDLARQDLDQALAGAEKTGDRNTAADALLGLSEVALRQNRAREALQMSTRALTLGQEASLRDVRRRALEALAAAQEKAGDYAAALATYKEFKDENDRIFDEEKSRRLENVEQRYQLEKREAEIARLKRGEAERAGSVDRQRLQLNLMIGASLFMGLIGFGVYRRRVESARIAEQLSVTDSLTGLKNRRYVMQTIAADLAAVQRRRRDALPAEAADADLVFLLIDIDRFKSVNDEFGHRAGDMVLTQFATILRDICRASDTLVRWGGEEFLIVSRFSDRRRASAFAERVRSEIERGAFQIGNGRTVHRTCSVGFASYPFSLAHPDALSWEQIVAVADDALYMAKRAGANAWVGVTASGSATEDVLRRRSSNGLDQWIDEGVAVKESSRESVVGSRESGVLVGSPSQES
jgi:diguanylate cyclase (GGDEF)-like protein